MNGIVISMVVVPGVVALLLFFVFTYLYEQSRQLFFRAWQLGWGAYTCHYLLDAWAIYAKPSVIASFFASLLLMLMALCVVVSTRLIGAKAGRERYRLHWLGAVLGCAGILMALMDARARVVGGVFQATLMPPPYLRVEVGCAA